MYTNVSIIWIINTAFMLFFPSSFKQTLCQKPRPKTKARSRRRAAPVELREPVFPLERQDVTSRTDTNGRTSRKRSSQKDDPRPQIQIAQSLSAVGDISSCESHVSSFRPNHRSACENPSADSKFEAKKKK